MDRLPASAITCTPPLATSGAKNPSHRLWRTGLAIAALLILAPVFLVLPLRFFNPPTSALMLIRRTARAPAAMHWRDFANMPAILPMSAIAAEDLSFCTETFGFDVDAITTQLRVWRGGQRPTGASTIAMQLSRNLFLWPERGMFRKALEAWITPAMATILPRHRQLELYLNLVEFGHDTFGIEAAAHHWYGISADRLNADQAARLMSILPAPLLLSPVAPGPALLAHSDGVRDLVAGGDNRLDCAR